MEGIGSLATGSMTARVTSGDLGFPTWLFARAEDPGNPGSQHSREKAHGNH